MDRQLPVEIYLTIMEMLNTTDLWKMLEKAYEDTLISGLIVSALSRKRIVLSSYPKHEEWTVHRVQKFLEYMKDNIRNLTMDIYEDWDDCTGIENYYVVLRKLEKLYIMESFDKYTIVAPNLKELYVKDQGAFFISEFIKDSPNLKKLSTCNMYGKDLEVKNSNIESISICQTIISYEHERNKLFDYIYKLQLKTFSYIAKEANEQNIFAGLENKQIESVNNLTYSTVAAPSVQIHNIFPNTEDINLVCMHRRKIVIRNLKSINKLRKLKSVTISKKSFTNKEKILMQNQIKNIKIRYNELKDKKFHNH